jgi:hypothetical protein
MLANSTATDRDRSLIAGHYVFSKPEVKELKVEAAKELEQKNIHLEEHLKQQIKQSILRYLHSFRLLNAIR